MLRNKDVLGNMNYFEIAHRSLGLKMPESGGGKKTKED